MIFLESIANTLGTFPDTTGRNASGGTATDGTPWIRAFIDNYFGLSQALLDYAGMTPDAATDVHDACQQLDALRYVSGPVGSIAAWSGVDADPSSLGIRLLPLTGQGVLRATYSDLDAACYVGDSANPTAEAFYRADDAAGTSRNIAGAYLILPDARGQALRGLDPTGTVDPLGASRAVGDIQADSLQAHYHKMISNDDAYYLRYALTRWSFGSDDRSPYPSATYNATDTYRAKDLETATGASAVKSNNYETRMTNLAVRWCIWF